jgi:DNA-binding LacI/PurR family transcriptional regulator
MLMRVTSETVAKRAGVSRATVSRVLNNNPNVSDQMKRRVMKVIDELNYRPSSVARSLRLQTSDIVGFMIPVSLEQTFADSFFSDVMSGICDAVSLFSLRLQVFTSSPTGSQAIEQLIESNQIAGVILHDRIEDPIRKVVLENGTPCIVIGTIEDEEDRETFGSVSVDNFGGVYRSVEHLIRSGYRKIAYIAGSMSSLGGGRDRLRGYQAALQDYGLECKSEYVGVGEFDRGIARQIAERMLETGDRPEAVVCANDLMALGVIGAASKIGLSVPGDLGVIGFNDSAFAKDIDPPLTTVRQPVQEIGYEAAKMLAMMIRGNGIRERHLVLPTQLIVRKSC